MTRKDYGFDYIFHPVGQGLFASGAIYQLGDSDPRFQWVYDCGTNSSQTLLIYSIARLPRSNNKRPHLNLVTLSHFDSDHINGVTELLSKFSVGTLLLPYLHLWQRLILAFREGISKKEVAFFINPVVYLTQLPKTEITEILFVKPIGDIRLQSLEGFSNTNERNNASWEIDFKHGNFVDAEEHSFFETTKKRTKIAYLDFGNTLNIAGLWEFVPYNNNDADLISKVDDSFQNAVKDKKGELLIDSDKRNQVLQELKSLYDKQFGKSYKKRNLISLFLYGGPICPSWEKTALNFCERNDHGYCMYHLRYVDYSNRCHNISNCCSILYTGDGYLDTQERLNQLIDYLGNSRVKQISVFQVMHHGAKSNWHSGVAEKINPIISIFSSDPDNKQRRHPHISVLRDFWKFNPIQVDTKQGVTITGWLEHK